MCDKKRDEKSHSETTCLMNKINDDIITHKIMPFFVLKEIFCVLILVFKRFGIIIPQVIHDKIYFSKEKYKLQEINNVSRFIKEICDWHPISNENCKWHPIKLNVNTVIYSNISFSKITVQNIKKLLNVKKRLHYNNCNFDEKYETLDFDILFNTRSLRISSRNDLNMSLLENFKNRNINDLCLLLSSFTSDIIDGVLDMKDLETLDLGKRDTTKNKPIINSNHITKISKLTKLKNLSISGFNFNSSNCDTHVFCSLKLIKLEIVKCIIREKDVLNLISPSLKTLVLFNLDITNDLIMHISHLKKQNVLNLTCLSISYCSKITNNSLEYLNDLNLSSLELCRTSIDDLSSLYIPGLSKLVFFGDNISEEKIQNVFDMPLTHLSIVGNWTVESKRSLKITTLKNISEKCRTIKELQLTGFDFDFDINDITNHLSGMNFDKLTMCVNPDETKNIDLDETKNIDLDETKNIDPVETKNIDPDGTKNIDPDGTKNIVADGTKNIDPKEFTKIDQLVRANVIKNHKSFMPYRCS
jgi:hypothetical protein